MAEESSTSSIVRDNICDTFAWQLQVGVGMELAALIAGVALATFPYSAEPRSWKVKAGEIERKMITSRP